MKRYRSSSTSMSIAFAEEINQSLEDFFFFILSKNGELLVTTSVLNVGLKYMDYMKGEPIEMSSFHR